MINMDNYEGYLYLYQEGELDSQTRAEVERFLMEHPDIREEMDTYYDPSFVVTAEQPAKRSRRIVPLWRWSAAACAVLAIGIGVYTLLAVPSSPEGLPLVAEQNPLPITYKWDTAPSTQPKLELHNNHIRHASHPSLPDYKDASIPSSTDIQQDAEALREEATTTEPVKLIAAQQVYTDCQLAEETILVDCLAEEYTIVDNLAAVEGDSETQRGINLLAVAIDYSAKRQMEFMAVMKDEVFPIFRTSDSLRTI